MDAFHRHRSLYKGTTSPWKEAYRKGCVDRLKNSRSRLLDRYRQTGGGAGLALCPGGPAPSSIVQEVMEAEWSALRADSRGLWRPGAVEEVLGVLEDHDQLAMLEEIQQELQAQELSIIEEYEKSLQREELYVSSLVRDMEEGPVVCPVCHRDNLTFTSHFTSCACGVYISTAQGNLTPEALRGLLEARVSEHAERCLHQPLFSVAAGPDGPRLMMGCQACHFLSVIL